MAFVAMESWGGGGGGAMRGNLCGCVGVWVSVLWVMGWKAGEAEIEEVGREEEGRWERMRIEWVFTDYYMKDGV